MTLTITVDLPDRQAPEVRAGELALILANVAARLEAHPQYIAPGYHREIRDSDNVQVGTLEIQ